MPAPSVPLLKLHRALTLINAEAGRPVPPAPDWAMRALDRAYGEQPTLLQAQVDRAIGAAAAYAADGADALAASPSPAAAAVLADALAQDLLAIERVIGVQTGPVALGVDGSAPHSAQLPS